jgi:hypothetical protein
MNKPIIIAGASLAIVSALLLARNKSSKSSGSTTISRTEQIAAIEAAYSKTRGGLAAEIVNVADRLDIDSFSLANLINFESAQTFSPSVRHPSTGAVGLIQFMGPTAAELLGWPREGVNSYTASQEYAAKEHFATMDWRHQMTYVERYLRNAQRARGKLDTPHKIAMAVFLPTYVDNDPNDRMPSWVTSGNPGIYTGNDYVQFMLRNANLPATV